MTQYLRGPLIVTLKQDYHRETDLQLLFDLDPVPILIFRLKLVHRSLRLSIL